VLENLRATWLIQTANRNDVIKSRELKKRF